MIFYLVPLLVGIFIGLILFYFLSRFLVFKSSSTQIKVIPYSEEEAVRLLENNSYKVLEKQKQAPIITRIDGKSHLGHIMADFLVEKDNKKYAVKVRTGEGADPHDPVVRRQLIEYDYVYKPIRLLFLDMNAGEIHEISFDLPRPERETFFFIFMAVFVILIIIGIIWLLIQLKLF